MPDHDPKINPLRDYWLNHLWVDVALVSILVGAHGVAVMLWPFTDLFGLAIPADRRAVYSSAAIVVSLLGSFSGVAIGQLGSAKGPRTSALKRQAGGTLVRNWQAVFITAMLAASVALLALLIDPSVAGVSVVHVAVRWVFEFVMLLAVVRFVRLSTLFREVMSVATREGGEAEPELLDAPNPQPGWHKRQVS